MGYNSEITVIFQHFAYAGGDFWGPLFAEEFDAWAELLASSLKPTQVLRKLKQVQGGSFHLCDIYKRVSYFHLLNLGLVLSYSFALFWQMKTAGEVIDCEMATL